MNLSPQALKSGFLDFFGSTTTNLGKYGDLVYLKILQLICDYDISHLKYDLFVVI